MGKGLRPFEAEPGGGGDWKPEIPALRLGPQLVNPGAGLGGGSEAVGGAR